MQFLYIEKNLDKILDYPENILYIKPYKIGKKEALFAVIKEDKATYKRIQITKEQSKGSFPYEPIYWFKEGPGYILLRDYINIDNYIALNPTNMDGFRCNELDDAKLFNVGIYATFYDGSATFVQRDIKRHFAKNGGINKFNNLLTPYKDIKMNYDSYYVIDTFFDKDNIAVIPQLLSPTDSNSEIKYEDLDANDKDITNTVKTIGNKK